MQELSSVQRKYLRGQAHHLEPLVLVGKQGVTETLVRSVSQALDAHELIKVRFNEHKPEKKALVEEICRQTGCAAAGIVGHVAILYREQSDPQKRKIVLPR
ncbi:MAG: ribosome assembly RNA-binding protein YhbY [Candidatus Hydrogenedentes bacterium]|nr:ribosome assembly RNA-binding protein YhbY [Candidatus Hydrogenedentota bacterium]